MHQDASGSNDSTTLATDRGVEEGFLVSTGNGVALFLDSFRVVSTCEGRDTDMLRGEK